MPYYHTYVLYVVVNYILCFVLKGKSLDTLGYRSTSDYTNLTLGEELQGEGGGPGVTFLTQ